MQTMADNAREAGEAALEASRCFAENNAIAEMWTKNPMAEAWNNGLESLRS
jgi:hypothetical protein